MSVVESAPMGGDTYHIGPVGVDASGLIPTFAHPVPPRLRERVEYLRRLMRAIDDAEELLEQELEALENELLELECEVGIDDEHHDPEETDGWFEG